MITLNVHTGLNGERHLPKVRIVHYDSFTATRYTFHDYDGSGLEITLLDSSPEALREREELTYSWGGPP